MNELKETKSELIKFKVTQSEFEQLTQEANDNGHVSVNVYARYLIQTRNDKVSNNDLKKIMNAFNDLKISVDNAKRDYLDDMEYVPFELMELNRKMDVLFKLIMSLK